MSLDSLASWLLVGSLVVLFGVLAVRFSVRSGLPSLLIYLAIGLLLGERFLGVRYDNALLTEILGYAALTVILIEGGITTQWRGVKRSIGPAVSLATFGVLVSVGVVAFAAHAVLGLPWQTALIVGAVLSSTDAAAVFSVLRRVPLPRRVSGILEVESGLNDPPVVILVTLFSLRAAGQGGDGTWLHVAAIALMELAGGLTMGLVIGWLGVACSRRSPAAPRPSSPSASSRSRSWPTAWPIGSTSVASRPVMWRRSCWAISTCRTGPPSSA